MEGTISERLYEHAVLEIINTRQIASQTLP